MKFPKLTLVGAGPGDPELITLKAVKALKDADVVLYDNLANSELLEYCKKKADLIYVGKKGHKRGISQDKINDLIVSLALEKGHVVRLKGGDPFIFGRGVEEINFVRERGIPAVYIPGVSSVNAVGLSGISLTDRNHSDGFWVITGHKSDGSLSKDIQLAAQSNSTLVVLMGMRKLEQISGLFRTLKKGNTPAALIQNISKANQKICLGKVSDLNKMAIDNEISNPALLIIGESINALKYGFGEVELIQKLSMIA